MNNLPSIMADVVLADDQCIVALDDAGNGWILARSDALTVSDVLMELSTEDNGFDPYWDKGLLVGVYLVSIKPWSYKALDEEWDCGVEVTAISPLWTVERMKGDGG